MGDLSEEVASYDPEKALAETLEVIGGEARKPRQTASRQTVLSIYEGLARRYHAAGDARLYEVLPSVRRLVREWGERDRV